MFRPGPGATTIEQSQYSGEMYDYEALESALKVNPWVAACIRAIREAVVSIPLRVWRELPDDKRERVTHSDANGGDLVSLLWQPNLRTSVTDLIGDTASYIAMDGEAIWFVNNGSNETTIPSGRPQSIQVLKPRFVSDVTFLANGQVDKYVYNQNNNKITIAPEFIVHPKTFNPFDDSRGLPPVEVAKHPILLEWYMTRYAERFFQNDARPSGALVSSHPLDPEIKKQNIEFWVDAHMGVENAHKIAHLDADTKYESFGDNNKDAEFLGLDKMSREQILAVWGVPPVIVGILESANYANSKEQMRLFYEFTVKPMLRLIEGAINTQFIPIWWPDRGLFVEFDVQGVDALQEDKVQQAQRHNIYFTIGALSPNEIRRDLGLEPRDGGDEYKPVAGEPFSFLSVGPDYDTKAVIDPSVDDQWAAFDRMLMIGERTIHGTMIAYFKAQEERILAKINALFVEDSIASFMQLELVKNIDPALIFAIFEEEVEAALLAESVFPMIRSIMEQVGKRAMRQVKPSGVFRVADPRVSEFIAGKVFKLGNDVSNKTRRVIQKILVDGSADDLSVGQLSANIRDTFKGFRKTRAVTIARTEALGASNAAAVEGYRQSEVVQRKQWLTTRDGNVRDSHAAIDGEIVPLSSRFSNGLEAPGVGGPPEEVINCRCTVLPVLED